MTLAKPLKQTNLSTRGSRVTRRRILTMLAVASGIAVAFPVSALGQSAFPSKPFRIVVPFGAGSSPDIIARLLGERLSKGFGQPVIVDNRAGASTIIGAQAVATAPADGYTLLYTVNNTTSINPYVYRSLPYKAEEFVPVVRVLSVPYVLITGPNSPHKTLSDLISAAKANPGKLSYASYGIGQGTHVAMARLLNTAGASMVHVPYKESPGNDVINGLVDALFEPTTTAIANIKAGNTRALAVSGPKRVSALPDVPAVNETFDGFVGDSWHGLLGPKGMPQDAVAKINTLSQRIIASEDFQRRLEELGLVPAGGTPEDFKQFLVDDAKSWSKVVRDNDIKID